MQQRRVEQIGENSFIAIFIYFLHLLLQPNKILKSQTINGPINIRIFSSDFIYF